MRQGASIRNRRLIALSILLVGMVVAIAIAAELAPTLLPVGDRIAGDGRSIVGPVALAGLIITVALITLFHRAEFAGAVRLQAPEMKGRRLACSWSGRCWPP